MRILVTGGCGFIGTNVIRHLVARGHACTILDDLSAGTRAFLQDVPYRFVQGDILDPERVAEAAREAEAIVHLAARTSVVESIRDPAADHRVNVEGTLRLLEAARRGGVRRFVFASSNAPLGEQEPPADETRVPHPLSPYGASKMAGEGYCFAYHGSYGLETVALRFANVYGPYSSHKTSVVAQFIRDARDQGTFTIYGDGRQTRDFLYVGDLCVAVEAALERPGVGGECFQVGTGRETEVLELARLLQAILTPPPRLIFQPERRGEIRRNYTSIRKAAERLGYRPLKSLEDGLAETVAWFRRSQAPPA